MPLPLPFQDVSITSLSGSSQTAAVAKNHRRFLLIENTGSANIGVNLCGGTAAIGGTGTVTIVANGSLMFDRVVPNTAINVIGTAGQPVTVIQA